MRVCLILGAALLVAIYATAAPTEDGDPSVPTEEPCDTVGYRKETLDTVNKKSSVDHTNTKTKEREKVRTKKLKGGMTMTIIEDTTKTKTKKDSISDEYSQTNHTLTEDGLEDSSSLTDDKRHEVKEVDTIKKKDKEVIIRDKYGNVVSDTKKEKVKEKTKKKEKDKESKRYVHTVKKVAPPADDEVPPAPAPDC